MDAERTELRASVRAVLGDQAGQGVELSRELLGKVAAQLADLGYLDAGDAVADGGLGIAGDCVIVDETARHWGALAAALVPRLLAGHALGRDAVTGTGPLDWGLAVAESDAAAVLNGGSAHRLLLADGVAAVDGGTAPAVEFDGFRELDVTEWPVEARIPAAFSRPAAEIGASRRLLFASVATGLGRGALTRAARYAGERVQFGRPIGMFGEIRAILTEASVRLTMAELAVTALAVAEQQAPEVAAVAVLAGAAETAVLVADRCQHVHGGYGHMAEFPIGRITRDARTLRAWTDTVPALQELVAGDLGLPAVS